MATDHVSASVTVQDIAAPPEALDVTGCDREAIHVPGSIQPHGLMVIADAGSLRIVGGAGEIATRINPHWESLSLAALLGRNLDVELAQLHSAPGSTAVVSPVSAREGVLDATLHRSGDWIVAELEPSAEVATSAAAMLIRLDALGTSFERASDLKQLCERAAIAFRELTGFDRVMIYRFLDDAAGVVVAEDRDPALGSFINHHFPASDIPRQARALYVRNRVRVIPDVSYDPAPIFGRDPSLADIDLSDASLRSVSPIHLQYLKNMGVQASASISIVKDGLLWGLVACHNNSPRMLGLEARAACRALAGGLARQIRAREEAETYRERIRLRGTEDQILGRFDETISFETMLQTQAEAFRRMLNADGFAAIVGEEIVTAGHCPDRNAMREIGRWLRTTTLPEPVATHNLEVRLPVARAWRDCASGLMAVSLPIEVQPTTLLWFRAEEPQTVEWAGNPHKGALGPDEVLTPRSSFEAWSEVLRGHARRWTLEESEAVMRLRRMLIETRQSRRFRDLNRELAQIVTQKEALLVEKDHLLREVNHRVQNSLQLVQAFLSLQARAEDNEALRSHLGEAQRRLSAVALVHRRLYQADQVETIDIARYLEELIGEMRTSMGDEWQGKLTLDLAPVLISADRAVNVGLILTELVINANKYAYGGGAGAVAISLERYRNQFRLIVADQGVGKVRDHQGFGTRMMNAMVQRLDGTLEQTDNEPGLRVILTAPIEQA